MADAQSVETVSEAFGKGEAAKAKRWINELTLSEKNQDAWLERCRQIIRKYKNERATSDALMANDRRRFAVLWSNVEVLKPAVYAKPPQAVVLRRFKDQDPLGRTAAEILERALNYSIDVYDFDGLMRQCRDDNLLTGIGVTWTRYVPTIEQEEAKPDPEKGEQVSNDAQFQGAELNEQNPRFREYLSNEQVICDHVNYADFGTNKARTWAEVRFVWRRVYMAREALKERFTTPIPGQKQTIGEALPLDWSPEKRQSGAEGNQAAEFFQKAQIYEIWDLDSRKAYWVSKSWPMRVLDEVDDPLGLKDFFPCPRPVFATLGPDSIIPVPDYLFYQDQAEEIDDLTKRIGILTDSLRLVGFYAGESEVDLQNVFRAGNENKLVPIDSWAQFKESGGVRGQIEWVPIDMVVAALTACYESRKQLLDDVYQITGISDIMRGDTDPRETKGAQVLKSEWGSSRVRERQKELARFARDALRIKAEIIAEHFSWQTLKAMTNVSLLTQKEKSLIQQQMQMMQQLQPPSPSMGMPSTGLSDPSMQQSNAGAPTSLQPGMPQAPMGNPQSPMPSPPQMSPQASPLSMSSIQPDPAKVALMEKPTWEEIESFLRDDALRRFRIDVETDSTIEPNSMQEKQDMVEWVGAIGGFLQQSLPVVMAAPPMGELIGEVVKQGSRKFAFGREMEDVIDRVMEQVGQMSGPANQPEETAAAGPDPQIEALKAQIEQMKIAQKEQADARADETKRLEIMVKRAIEEAKIQNDKEQRQADQDMAWLDAQSQRVHESEMAAQQGMRDDMSADKDRMFQSDQSERDRQFGAYESSQEREHGAGEAQLDRDAQARLVKNKPRPN